MRKKAQTMGVPFQLIFSLILVAVVIIFGFLAIKMFLERAEQAKFGVIFTETIKSEIENAFDNSAGETNKTITLTAPKNIEAICFLNGTSCSASNPPGFCADLDLYRNNNENFFFYPLGRAEEYKSSSGWTLLCQEHSCIDFTKSRPIGNPKCYYKNLKGKIEFRVIKEFGEPLVKISNV